MRCAATLRLMAVLLAVVGVGCEASAQALPEDPSAALFMGTLLKSPKPGVAPKYAKRIRASQTARTIDERDKIILGLHDLYSPFSLLGIVASSGYSHLVNGQPNYGTNGDAFAERFGATAVRDTTEGLFTDAVFAPLLHEDPRYFVQGRRYGLVHRTVYAVSRTFVTRTDSGGSSLNGALLLGYAASSALSYTYYPQINRNFDDTAKTYGTSVGGAAFGFVASEFTDDVLELLHLEKKP